MRTHIGSVAKGCIERLPVWIEEVPDVIETSDLKHLWLLLDHFSKKRNKHIRTLEEHYYCAHPFSIDIFAFVYVHTGQININKYNICLKTRVKMYTMHRNTTEKLLSYVSISIQFNNYVIVVWIKIIYFLLTTQATYSTNSVCLYVCVCVRAHMYLCRAENRLLGANRTGPFGRTTPPSFTHCR